MNPRAYQQLTTSPVIASDRLTAGEMCRLACVKRTSFSSALQSGSRLKPSNSVAFE